jgi:hypothetical protein
MGPVLFSEQNIFWEIAIFFIFYYYYYYYFFLCIGFLGNWKYIYIYFIICLFGCWENRNTNESVELFLTGICKFNILLTVLNYGF